MTSPAVELYKINSTDGRGDMPPPDAPELTIPTYVPDEETKAVTEVLKVPQKQLPTASPSKAPAC